MDLKQAEQFYKKYQGLEFQMYREDKELYDHYKQLVIPEDLKNKWKYEVEEELRYKSLYNSVKHLYLHVPFCNNICYYCDFTRIIYNQKIVDQWLDTLKEEVNDKCHNQYETIYIGGGTPSCLNYDELKRLLNIIIPYTNEVKEYTIEINPDSVDENKIKLFKDYGINRVSIGVQTSDDELLKSLNRKHDFETVKNVVGILKDNGIDNISVDLMYSLPNQSIDMLKMSIEDILSLDIRHISIYSLTIEENSVFFKKGIKSLDEDTEADMYELIEDILTKNNYIHYEVSNYCLEGYESRHNLAYWNYEDFLGVSLAASSKIGKHRYTNTLSFKEYFEDYNKKSEDLHLERKDLMFENIMMSLRTKWGLDINEFNKRYECNFLEIYKEALKDQRLKIIDNHLVCDSFETLNNILLKFMD